MLDWGGVAPSDLRCPTLWVIGTENTNAMLSYHEVEAALPGSPVQAHLLDGMNHAQEFDEIKRLLPVVLAFMGS
jgi:pimeloyl-ACP methyl ester carboxylesterase